MKPMRIALVAPSVGPLASPGEGIARYTAVLARGLAAVGHEVAIVTTGDAPQETVEDGVRRIVVDWVASGRRPYAQDFLTRAVKVRDAIVGFSPDVVESTNYGAPSLLVPRQIPLVVRCATPDALASSGGDDAQTAGQALSVVLEGVAARRADVRLYLSRASRDTIARVYRLQNVHERITPLALPDPGPCAFPSSSSFSVLHVGALSARKGADTLLRAFARVAAHSPSAHLVLVGRDNELDTDPLLNATWSALNDDARRRVHRLGRVSEVELEAAYAACAAVVVPSRYESFGIVVLEAAFRARAVIAAKSGALVDVVGPEGAPLLFAPNDDEGLADRWLSLLADVSAAKHIGAQMRASALTRFSLDRFVDDTVRIYRSVLR